MTDTKIGEVILDQSFVKRVQKGEHDAVDALYNACFSVLMNVAVRYKTNRADQITLVHIAFMKALDHLSDFTLGTSFIAWIKTILQREIIDDFRRNKRSLLQIGLEKINEVGQDQDFDENTDLPVETNFSYMWFEVDQFTGEAKFIFKTETIWNQPNWKISGGILSYEFKVKNFQQRLD